MKRSRIKSILENPWRIIRPLSRHGLLDFLPDKVYLSLSYRSSFGRKMNWKNPSTFSEKLQWIKLNDRNPVYTHMVDKFEAKAFCEKRISSQYVVPAVGGPWSSVDEIDFESLPNQFVLKTNHDCGGVIVCPNKATFDFVEAKRILNEHLHRRYYLTCREWPYKNVEPKIFAETYLQDQEGGGVHDYKFFTFNGEPKVMYIAGGRDYSVKEHNIVYADFFDMEFNHLELKIDHENAPVLPDKPKNFEQMIEVARKLAQGTKHLRVDFYEMNGHMYVGELTFFHCGGLKPFITDNWDAVLGSWIDLS